MAKEKKIPKAKLAQEGKITPAEYLEGLRFRKQTLNGLDEADVWRKINILNTCYEKYIESQKDEAQTETSAQAIRKKRLFVMDKLEIRSFFIRLTALIIFIWVMFGFLFGIAVMPDNSMSPRMSAGDVILYYRLNHSAISSDIVVLEKDNKTYVGRVVAKGGDSVEIKDEENGGGSLYINGSMVMENDIYYTTRTYDSDVKYPVTLGGNEVFVLCDYREGAKDSRYYGPVNTNEIKGKAIAILRRTGL